jgi:hypothetical protein
MRTRTKAHGASKIYFFTVLIVLLFFITLALLERVCIALLYGSVFLYACALRARLYMRVYIWASIYAALCIGVFCSLLRAYNYFRYMQTVLIYLIHVFRVFLCLLLSFRVYWYYFNPVIALFVFLGGTIYLFAFIVCLYKN